ncbi:hypothetical protein ACIRON_02675 [Nocardioides sp. NPDC101246]|uniref:hypothetical protein n=1 Tax=Nocardioides sp. NPDC101246 TaxID=3364336 RepID=UPI00382DAD79
MQAELQVGGVWLSSLGPWGDLQVEDRWPGGNYEVRCTLDPKVSRRLPAIVNEADVRLTVGGDRWAGTLTEYDPETGDLVAQGYYRQGDGVPALNSSGMTTTTPNAAIDRAISSGWVNWRRPVSLSSSPYSSSDAAGDATAEVNALGSLLDEWAAGSGKRWGVDEQRVVYATADPSEVTHLLINTPAPVQSGQRAAGTVVARWQNSSGAYATTIRGNLRPIVTVDFTNAGPLTSGQVTARCDRILSSSAGAATVGGFTITRDQIVGRPHLSIVRAGQRVSLVDQASPDLSALAPSVVLGITVWNVDEDTVECTPVDAPDLDLQSIIEAQGGIAA